MEATFKIKWTTDLRELRKSFTEVDKYQQRQTRTQRTEVRQEAEKQKRAKQFFQQQDRRDKANELVIKRQGAQQAKLQREEQKHHKMVLRQTQLKQREEEKAHRQATKNYQARVREEEQVARRKKGPGNKGNWDGTNNPMFEGSRGGGGGGAGRRQGGGTMGKVAGVGGFLAGGLAGLLMGSAFRGYESYIGTQKSLSSGVGRGGGNLMAGAHGAGRGGNLGFNVEERAGMAPAMLANTGVGGAKGIRAMMTASRASGMGTDQVADIFGALRMGGTQFSGTGTKMDAGGKERLTIFQGKGKSEFTRILSAGMQSGLEKGRVPEFVEGVGSFIRQQAQVSGGTVDGAGFARLAAVLGKTGGAALQGSRGMSNLMRIDSAIKTPGGGEEGMGFMQRAMGFGSADSGVGYHKAERMREQGLGDPENFQRIMKQAAMETGYQAGGDKDEMSNYLRSTGVASSYDMADKLIEAMDKGGTSGEMRDEVAKIQKQSLTLEEQSQKSMKESATHLEYIAAKFDRSVKIGEESKDLIEKVEHLQNELVDAVIDAVKFWKELFADVRKTTMGKAIFGEGDPGKALARAEKEQAKALAGDEEKRAEAGGARVRGAVASSGMDSFTQTQTQSKNRKSFFQQQYLDQVAPGRAPTPDELKASLRVAKGAAGGEAQRGAGKDFGKKYVAGMAGQGVDATNAGKLPELVQQLILETRANRPVKETGASYHPTSPGRGPVARRDATGQ